jgi:hypothetical protein
VLFPWKSKRQSKIQEKIVVKIPKVAFFFSLEMCIVEDFDSIYLIKRNMILVNWCCMSKSSEESVEHYCFIWSLVDNAFEGYFFFIDKSMHLKVIDVFLVGMVG